MKMVILVVILVLMLGTAAKLKNARKISLGGAVSGNANFDGSGNITITTTQANIAVIEGTMTLDANTPEALAQGQWTSTQKTFSYPAGYNKSNCIVLAFGTIQQSYYDSKGYSFQDLSGTNTTSLAYLVGAIPKNVALQTDNIHMWIANINTESKVVKYKIVLMKIS